MPTMQQLEKALVAADQAGDEQAAIALAREIKARRQAPKQAQNDTDMVSKTRVVSGGMLEGIPVIGPAIRGGVERAAAATIAGPMDWLSGKTSDDVSYGDALKVIQEGTAREKQANPILDVGSQITGAVASTGGLGMTGPGAKILGMTGKTLPQQMRNMAVSGGMISGMDTLARGGDTSDVLQSAGIGGLVGGAIPFLGAGLRAGTNKAKDVGRAVFKPEKAAEQRVANALADDIAEGAILSQDDIAKAGLRGQPITVADAGGETTQALARSAANNSPQARTQMAQLGDRFGQQYERATDFVSNLVGNKVDDIAYRENIIRKAANANRKNYRGAFRSPKAQNVWNEDLARLMQSPAVAKAAKGSTTRSANRAALDAGATATKNPFVFAPDGSVSMKPGVAPTLEFWNDVKINLDDMHSAAKRTGKNSLAMDYDNLRKALIKTLDKAVPSYKKARAGAAAAFGAEDAVDAGKKAVHVARQNNELVRNMSKMNKAELEGFRIGYASELIDKIRQAGERTDVINRVFGSPEAKKKLGIVLGQQKAKELESFIRVENAMKMLQNAVRGNSTTARQLAEIGLGGGAGYMMSGGDLTTAALGAVAGRGGAVARNRIGKEIGRLLMSQDPADIERLVRLAATNRTAMHKITQLEKSLYASMLGGAVGTAGALQN